MPFIPVPVPPPRSIAGGTRPRTVSATEATIYEIDEDLGLDFNLGVSDLFVQFGGNNLTPDTFDPALALYYPVTDAFGIEPIGPPSGSTAVAVMGVQPGAQIARRSQAPMPSYGGTRQSLIWGTADTILQCNLNASISALPVTIIARCRTGATLGVIHPFVALLGASDTANNVPRLALRVTAADVWNAVFQKTVANSNGSGGSVPVHAGEWTTAIANFVDDGSGHPLPTVWRNDVTGGEGSAVGTSPAQTTSGTYTRMVLGLPHATGQTFYSINDEISEVMVLADTLTVIEMQQFAEDPSPPWDQIVSDPTKIRAWVRVLSKAPRREWSMGKDLAVSVGTSGHVTATTYGGTIIRNHNRLVTMDTSGILKVTYGAAASGEQATPANSSCLWRAEAHHKIRYDASSGTADATAAGYQTVEAGVGLLYALGGAVDIDVINDSGSAGDVGTLNLTGLTYDAGYYTAFQTGLTVTQSNGTVDYVGTGRTGANFRISKPTTGSNWPMIINAVGAGGLHTEYDELAIYCAARGYCFVNLSFEDEGQSGPLFGGLFVWPDRISEFREFVEDWLLSKAGYQPTRVIISGHSGGAFTSLPACGANWWGNGNTIPHNLGICTPDGGGTIYGCVQMSGQGTQDEQAGVAIRDTAWATLDPACWYVFFTGTLDDSDEQSQPYTWRLLPYDDSPTLLRKLKVVYLNGHHLYGGALTTATSGANPAKQKMRGYLHRRLFLNQYVAFCDACTRRGDDAHAWISNQMWTAEPTLINLWTASEALKAAV